MQRNAAKKLILTIGKHGLILEATRSVPNRNQRLNQTRKQKGQLDLELWNA
jgi:hypothetical protein